MNAAVAFKFEPFSPKQKKVLTWWTSVSPYRDYDMIIADGSVRAGKTIPMIDSFITWSLHTFEHQNFIIASRSMGALKRNILRPMFAILAAKGIAYRHNRSENYVQIGTNTYYLFGASTEASQDVVQGLTAAGALLDEIALFPESFVEQAMARCSVDGAKVFATCNPAGGSQHWFKVNYIDQARKKRILYLHFTMDDNWTLSRKVKERYRRMFTGLWYKRYILGLWVMAEGAIYDMFDEAIHVVDALPNLPVQTYLVPVDYATGNPTAFLKLAVLMDPKDRLPKVYVVGEYYWDSKAMGRQKTDAEYSQDLKAFVAKLAPTIYVDPSAASLKAQMRKDAIHGVKDCDNSVLDGIRLVSSFWAAGRLFVIKGKAPNLLREISGYVWDPKAQAKGEDRPIKQADHALDALRYAIYSHFKREGLVTAPAPKHPSW